MTNEQVSKDIDALYRQGKEHLAAREYDAALAAFRQVRLKFAGHYQDTDQLIVEAQTAMQKQKWQARPPRAASKINPLVLCRAVVMRSTHIRVTTWKGRSPSRGQPDESDCGQS